MTHLLREYLGQHRLAGPLSIWGKLPGHGDFLRHRTTAMQAHAWQDWVGGVWNRRPASLADVPVCFVMQAAALPFAPGHCIQGVAVASSDAYGRSCPLIFFQIISHAWLRRTWDGGRQAQPDGNILFWLARIAAQTHAKSEWSGLTRTVDALWVLFRPGWPHGLGAPPPSPARRQLCALVQQYSGGADSVFDSAAHLRGVQRMPWADWPRPILSTSRPMHAFWQQDARGGYVAVSHSLTDAWEGC